MKKVKKAKKAKKHGKAMKRHKVPDPDVSGPSHIETDMESESEYDKTDSPPHSPVFGPRDDDGPDDHDLTTFVKVQALFGIMLVLGVSQLSNHVGYWSPNLGLRNNLIAHTNVIRRYDMLIKWLCAVALREEP